MATQKEQLKDLYKKYENLNTLITSASSGVSVNKQAHDDCQVLQTERKEELEAKIGKLETTVTKEHTDRKKEIKDLEKDFIDTQSRFNIVASNVKDLIELKNKIDDRVAKLILTIVAGIVIAVGTKVIDHIFPKRYESESESVNVQVEEVKEVTNGKSISVPKSTK